MTDTGSVENADGAHPTAPQAVVPGIVSEAPAKKKGPRGQVTIFGKWCKGCGICVAFCPTGVLTLDHDGRPVVSFPEKCSACHWCDTHCPDLAIIVRPIE
ncbi:MAG: 4Fe-4S binding protein [Anaerolineales bacterium]|nr:4Fe-4S binding protein [Anaerolineales bacterium]